jgi:hypothetical protein
MGCVAQIRLSTDVPEELCRSAGKNSEAPPDSINLVPEEQAAGPMFSINPYVGRLIFKRRPIARRSSGLMLMCDRNAPDDGAHRLKFRR